MKCLAEFVRGLAGICLALSAQACSDDTPSQSEAGGSGGSAGKGSGGKPSPGGGFITPTGGTGTSLGGGGVGPCAGPMPPVSCPRPDEVPAEALASADAVWESLALDDEHVYATNNPYVEKEERATITAIAKGDGSTATIYQADERYHDFGPVEYADGYVYWRAGTLDVVGKQYAALNRLKLPTGEKEELHRVTSTEAPNYQDGTIASFAVDGPRVVVSQIHDSSVWAMDAAGGNELKLAQPPCDSPTALAVADGYAYFGSQIFGQVLRTAVSGATPQVVLRGVDVCIHDGPVREVYDIAVSGNTMFVGASGKLLSFDLNELAGQELGTKDLTETELWTGDGAPFGFRIVGERLFFMVRPSVDVGAIYVIGVAGDSKASLVISGFKIFDFVIEPDGESGYLSAYAGARTFLLPFAVP